MNRNRNLLFLFSLMALTKAMISLFVPLFNYHFFDQIMRKNGELIFIAVLHNYYSCFPASKIQINKFGEKHSL